MAAMDTIVMVCGSPGWVDAQPVEARLTEAFERVGRQHLVVIHGDGAGVDRFASDWCDRWHVTHKRFDTAWHRHGLTSVQHRNAEMLDFLAEQRKDMGAAVELAVFRLPDSRSSEDLDRTLRLAKGQRLTGHVVKPAA